jgi:hypothetical protein
LARTRAASAFERRAPSDDGHQQTWQPASEDTARTWGASSGSHGGQQNRLEKYVGQPTPPAAGLQSGDGCNRQKERTGSLGRADQWGAIPRRRLKVEPGLLEGSKKWADGSNRHTQTLSFIMALEVDQC